MIYRKVGDEVRLARAKRGLSQEKLAEKSGISTQHLGFIEQGRREPQLKTLRKIADALGVRVKDLGNYPLTTGK